ncbi:hypothetical protein QC762_511015 [Podospora pseudocomata]|uniref:Uncharacterized protein n=1 Tax=Podospora pseudocomata TaxID=2093779 RepID=A0ABR0GDR5_9PEZI|nr:hypothetical protein QC762_511015 [Podospora pseudocomata]
MSGQVSRRERRWWTKDEDDILRDWAKVQIDTHGAVKNWNEVAALLPDRTNKDCRKRWHKVRVDIKRGAWTPDEDRKLRQAVAQAGLKWSAVSKMMQTRNADQCAKRWQHVLGPDHRHDAWTPEEDRILQKAVAKYGNNWKQIGLLELPDRSTHDIRNRSVALNRRKRRSRAPSNDDPSTSTQYLSDDNADDNSSGGEESDLSSDDAELANFNEDQHMMMEVDAAPAPPTPTLSETLADASIFSNWEMASPATMLTQVRPLDADSHPWLWFSTESSSSGQTPDQHLSPENLSLAFESGQDMGHLMGGREIQVAPQISQNENPQSSAPATQQPPQQDYRGQAEAPGSVTVLLRQADSQLAQQVIGNLLNLNADVVIRLLKD